MQEKIDFIIEQDDRRKHPRIRSTAFSGVPIQLMPLPPYFGVPLMGELVNLSAGGMAIIIKELIPEGTKLQLEVTFPDQSILISTVRICRSKVKKEGHLIGIEFLNLPVYMEEKIEKMSHDYIDCESRIQAQAADVCRLNCAFFNICDKNQKKGLLTKMDINLTLSFKEIA